MEGTNIHELVERLGSSEDAVRKMAAFRLQSNIGDPSFADIFISEGGLDKLMNLVMNTNGNTLAYALSSLSRLLELDTGWDHVEKLGLGGDGRGSGLVKRAVELIIKHPLVNILRGAMSVLVAIVSHPYNTGRSSSPTAPAGLRALKPTIAMYPQFLEMIVSRLSSADHALCANALQLINALTRDAISDEVESEFPKFVKKLQELGVYKSVYVLMQSSALQDLAHPLIEFQVLMKVQIQKWRDTAIDLERPEHRRALKSIHLASNPERIPETSPNPDSQDHPKKHNPEKWRRLGFETEHPAAGFDEMGYLGMIDLTDYTITHQEEFQRVLLEQANQPPEKRCPIARASLQVTAVLYEHFEVEKSDLEDAKSYLALESRVSFDKVFKPLLLHWQRLHVAGLHAFFRLWKATGAEVEDLSKIVELVRILIESVVGSASRTKDIAEAEEELQDFDYQRLRELQMELMELTYEDVWGQHLRQMRDELQGEALQFVREQRIRCLLAGAWFPNSSARAEDGPVHSSDLKSVPTSFRYIQLSHNRRHLHWADFDSKLEQHPDLEELPEKIDLATVSSVVSNVSAPSDSSSSSSSSPSSSRSPSTSRHQPSTTTITIHGYIPSSNDTPRASRTAATHSHTPSKSSHHQKETVLLTLHPTTQSLASEWLDGLLMLLNQQPITAETNRLVNTISGYGLKIRLLNVRFDDLGPLGEGEEEGGPEVPSREGLDENYYYDVFGG
ncbi:MAG: hypothetical protein Q9227_006208 [Pyrenula ochraceoflavens]